ncbi:MAG TPA: acyltransferase [Dinghuibacter sp.]|uniref:acyltransferase family protein n=1 Tax=Dinghuibacter sp. TaxID=2024697 RepID=UPI002B889231|nr:acyltransferase [Dinghuibacter sp.]HTJ14902.1 acyltransferase [Dinghuibacter sp.]
MTAATTKAPNPSLTYRPQLDGLRFIAVFGVLFYHYNGWINTLNIPFTIDLGTFISFFFVLSSYLITSILLTNKHKGDSMGRTAYNFLVRRTLRIFPAYYFYLILLIAMPWGGHDVRAHPLSYFFYLSNYRTYFSQTWDNLTSHLWTLAVEEQFYIVWLWVILFVPDRHLTKIFYAVIASSVIWRIAFFLLHPGARTETVPMVILTPSCMDSFAFGGLLAIQQYYRKTRTRLLATIFLAWLPVWIILIVTRQQLILVAIDRVFASIGTMALIDGASRGFNNGFGKFLQHKVVTYLGKISYGIYLYHLLLPYVFWKIYNAHIHWAPQILVNPAVLLVWYFLLTVAFASVSWYLLEQPLSKLKKYFSYAASR